jgi:adenylate kinase family enzyme
MTRILIVGTSGSGKTTLGRALAATLELPFIETDGLCHGRGWREVNDVVLHDELTAVLQAPDWVIDNGYSRKVGDLVLHHAEAVIWLDLALRTCARRVITRSLRNLLFREELWNGNRQTFKRAFWGRDSLLVWTVRNRSSLRATIPDRVRRAPNQPKLVRLQTPAQVHSWFEACARGAHGLPPCCTRLVG